MERVCKPGGIVIIHLQLGVDGDKYSENVVHEPSIIYEYFRDSAIIKSRPINNSFDGVIEARSSFIDARYMGGVAFRRSDLGDSGSNFWFSNID